MVAEEERWASRVCEWKSSTIQIKITDSTDQKIPMCQSRYKIHFCSAYYTTKRYHLLSSHFIDKEAEAKVTCPHSHSCSGWQGWDSPWCESGRWNLRWGRERERERPLSSLWPRGSTHWEADHTSWPWIGMRSSREMAYSGESWESRMEMGKWTGRSKKRSQRGRLSRSS